MGEALEQNRDRLVALCAREAGKTLADGVAEVREAVDFCRYYAHLAERQFSAPETLKGPVGEVNQLSLHGRGVFVCISPWNFPLAIFTGQIAAALAAGNGVIAKPAEQTPLLASEAVRLFRAAGLPEGLLNLLPGEGATIGAALVSHPGCNGVAFTGGTETAWAINRALAARPGPIIPFIAETGGLNAMFVDTTALREQAEGEGHSVDWAARLDEASEALATTGFDLILLDIKMPHQNPLLAMSQRCAWRTQLEPDTLRQPK
jgi:RHH-type proline utilization regulon transcriptional repressor/proline dehydrogenase/delta 1-pyrroline-5-carboxylate dehydrogenase